MAEVTPFIYRVFLLRYWEESSSMPGEPGGRRYSLEDPSTGHRYGFSAAADLVRFLEDGPGDDAGPIEPAESGPVQR